MRRSFGALLLFWLTLLDLVHSFSFSLSPREPRYSLGNLSPCAITCWSQSYSISHCSFLDVECQCDSQPAISYVSKCVVDHCVLEDAIALSHVWAQVCNRPHNNNYVRMRAAAIGSGVAAFFMVACRIFARVYTKREFWWDDWCHITAGVMSIPLVTFSNLCVVHGMGSHLYDIKFPTIDSAQDLFLYYYLAEIFYCLVIYFIKMSILWLYIRIFPDTKYHRYFIAVMVFTTVAVAIVVPMVIWQCVPIDAIWNLDRSNAQCLSISGVAYASAGVNIATEVAILILPIPLLSRLRVSLSKKIAMYALFGAGILVIAIASARVPSLANVQAAQDPTYLNQGVFMWTCAETSAAHLCATALIIRPLYLKLHAEFIERKNSSTSALGTTERSGSSAKPVDVIRSPLEFRQVEYASMSDSPRSHPLHARDELTRPPISKSSTPPSLDPDSASTSSRYIEALEEPV